MQQFLERKFTYSDYSWFIHCFINRTVADRITVRTEVCIWLSVFIVQKESVIIVLLKCTEIKLFNTIIVHFKRQQFVNTKQEK